MAGRVELSSEYRALLDAVLDRPDDDMPRLAMADWLAEKGQGERADEIRSAIQRGDQIEQIITHFGRVFCRRGFVERVHCNLLDFFHWSNWIAFNWPIREVCITDRERYLSVEVWERSWSPACIRFLRQVRNASDDPRIILTTGLPRPYSGRIVFTARDFGYKSFPRLPSADEALTHVGSFAAFEALPASIFPAA